MSTQPLAPGHAHQRPLLLLVARPDGGPRRQRTLRRAAAMLRTGGWEVEAIATSAEDTADGSAAESGTDGAAQVSGTPWGAPVRRHLAQAEADGRTIAGVIAVGGDGIAHTVINVLMERAEQGLSVPAFGLIPAGSGNDLARHMRLPEGDPEMAAGRILRRLDEGAAAMDLGRLDLHDGTRRWFATAVCCGIDAEVSDLASSWSWPRGGLKYLAALPIEIMRHRPAYSALTITEPGGRTLVRGRRSLMLSVANTSSIGGGLPIMPTADPYDGTLDLLDVRALSRRRIVRLLPHLLDGTHLRLAEVETGPVQQIEIDGRSLVTADGETVGCGPLTVRCEPGVLPVLF